MLKFYGYNLHHLVMMTCNNENDVICFRCVYFSVNHCGMATHLYICALDRHYCLMPSHNLNHFWLIVNSALANTLPCELNGKTTTSFKTVFENAICNMPAILFRCHLVKVCVYIISVSHHCLPGNSSSLASLGANTNHVECHRHDIMGNVVDAASPYLYPCLIQYGPIAKGK